MRFNVDGKAFQQQLQAVGKVINAKNSLNILDNFLLRVEGDILSITGSDQENSLTARVAVTESEGDGIIAIPARRLLEITKEVSNQPITVEVDDDTKRIDIRFLNGHFEFMGIPGEDYPLPIAVQGENVTTMTLPAHMVSEGIEHTLYAASADTLRPVLMGIYWDIHEDDVTFVSSDTHKLVRYISRMAQPGFRASFILAPKAANILRSLIGKDMADVKLSFNEKSGLFEFGDYELTCMFINGVYPNYERVIPRENPFVVTVDRASILTALRRVTLFANKASNLVVVNVGDNNMQLMAQDLDYGMSAQENVNCDYDGNPMTIGFNGAFMVEIINNLPGDTIQLKLSDPARPGVYAPLTENDGQDTVVIQMPMQVI